MIRLAANLSMLFQDLPFLERFGAAAKAGFKGVEYIAPYEESAASIRAELDRHGLKQVLFNAATGDWAAGERGLGGNPDRTHDCRKGIDLAIEYARALDCQNIHLMAGYKPATHDLDACLAAMASNLTYAADAAAPHGITILVEAINSKIDMPGYVIDGTAKALDVIERAARKNIAFQYDVYHMQIMEGDLATTIEKNLNLIPHMQLADNPGRHEPGTGEINYPFLFGLVDHLGYHGWIGCEYRPLTTTDAGLKWIRPYVKEP